MTTTTCRDAFAGVLAVLHDQVLYSNVLYLAAGAFVLLAFPGWWRALSLPVLLVGVVSYVHHSNRDLGRVRASALRHLDAALAVLLLVAAVLSILLSARMRNAVRVNGALVAAGSIMGAASLGVFGMSQWLEHAKRIGGLLATNKSWTGPMLIQEAPQEASCSTQRYAVEYLAAHSAWHLLSGATILVYFVFLLTVLRTG